MALRWLRLLFVFGFLVFAFGAAATVDGALATGLPAILIGAVVAVPSAVGITRALQAHRGSGPTPTANAFADPALHRTGRALGTAMMVFSIAPFGAAVGLVWLGWHVPAADNGSAGARVGFLLLMCLFAVLPATLGYAYYRCGVYLRAVDLSAAHSVLLINRLVWIGGGIYLAVSLFDDRFDGRLLMKVVLGFLVVAAFAMNQVMVSVAGRLERAAAP